MINTRGNLVDYCWEVPEDDDHRTPVWRQFSLINAEEGEVKSEK